MRYLAILKELFDSGQMPKGDGRSDARPRAQRSRARALLSLDEEKTPRVEERRFESKKSLFE